MLVAAPTTSLTQIGLVNIPYKYSTQVPCYEGMGTAEYMSTQLAKVRLDCFHLGLNETSLAGKATFNHVIELRILG